ncbi:ATP-dependent DNA helicase RecG [Williamsia sterculiae]|uniref:ATP-dependent DNA helicase RecG n=1 Tax=Williamsia sterculiae TaxID=1344003 RepID=A0A1N7G5G0_9NOCA|nr:ATP-dependent DNA helicase RecG [Williamsia sterculiae]SIS07744.1 ATP-dependent DNA helicase RecG [Williamsia sterculiae]
MVALSDSLAAYLVPGTVELLADEIGVHTVGELIRHQPSRYVQRGALSAEKQLADGDYVTVVARIVKADMIPMRKRKGHMLRIRATDDVNTFDATFFHPYAIARALTPGTRAMLAGKLSTYRGNVQLTHPDWMVIPEHSDQMQIGGSIGSAMFRTGGVSDSGAGLVLSDFEKPFLPVYPATAKLQTWDIWACIKGVLDQVPPLPDALTETERQRYGYITGDDAVRLMHSPRTAEDIDAARERLKFDEALALQLALAQRRHLDAGQTGPRCPRVSGGLEDRVLQRLPFALTDGQQRVLDEITGSLDTGEPMSRLLQGEVGSGKTLVAVLGMLRMVDNGYQCALLAPTEVLAAQHLRTLRSLLGGLGRAGTLDAEEGATAIALITGSLKTAAKKSALLDAMTGQAGIVVGTHALLQDNVDFFNLGLIVVDEQHRFGVEQRDILRHKSRGETTPHVLVMTATPIPRTVAMTVYGDLQTSTLRELPAGRQPISTTVVPSAKPVWVQRVWSRIAEEIEQGRQAYVVCSRIGDDGTAAGAASEEKAAAADGPPTTSAVEMFDQLAGGELGRFRIGLLHGRLPADEKTAVMDAFGAGEIDVLVATTVVEVGVDVPNATAMVIVDAERFGVSQLHQLRGRVGRGGWPGLCLLMTTVSQSSQSMERLRAVEASNDGFELSMVDLEQRREGDVLGALQAGSGSTLRLLSLLSDGDLIAEARVLADEVVTDDLTLLQHPAMADLVDSVLGPHRIRYLDKS